MTRRVLVTGSSRGIGQAIAAAFVGAKDSVTVHARTLESASVCGRIVTVASVAALKFYAHTAAKYAVLGLTRASASDLACAGITVNAVCPRYTDTDLIAGSRERLEQKTGRDREALLAGFTRSNPMGRLFQPHEVASAMLYLASPAGGGITGQALAIAGGET